jgi:hypothetical protein
VFYDAIRYQWEKLSRFVGCINEGDKLGILGELILASLLTSRPMPNPRIYFKLVGQYQNFDSAAFLVLNQPDCLNYLSECNNCIQTKW